MLAKSALVVDDSKSARVMLGRLLKQLDISYNFVESGEEALEFLAHENAPDLIFMDHMMPGMDGLETTRLIVEDPKTAKIPVVMYTSQDAESFQKKAMESGALGVIVKPARLPGLTALLHDVEAICLERAHPEQEEQESSLTLESTVSTETPGHEMQIEHIRLMIEGMIEERFELIIEQLLTEQINPMVNSLNVKWQQEIKETVLEPLNHQLQALKEDISNLNAFCQDTGQLVDRVVIIEDGLTHLQVKSDELNNSIDQNNHDYSVIKQEFSKSLGGLQNEFELEIDKRLKPVLNAVDLHHKILDKTGPAAHQWRDSLLASLMPALKNYMHSEALDEFEHGMSQLESRLVKLENKKFRNLILVGLGLSVISGVVFLLHYLGYATSNF